MPNPGHNCGWLLNSVDHRETLRENGAEILALEAYGYDMDANVWVDLSAEAPESADRVSAICFPRTSTVTEECILAALSMPNLKLLSFDGAQIDQKAFRLLGESRSIELIGIGGTSAGDQELLALATIGSLRVVDVFQSDVTPAGIRQFEAIRPDVNVQDWYH